MYKIDFASVGFPCSSFQEKTLYISEVSGVELTCGHGFGSFGIDNSRRFAGFSSTEMAETLGLAGTLGSGGLSTDEKAKVLKLAASIGERHGFDVKEEAYGISMLESFLFLLCGGIAATLAGGFYASIFGEAPSVKDRSE